MPAPAVLLTRPAGQIARTAAVLSEHGFRVIELPLTRIAPPSRRPSARQLAEASKADAWIFTSSNAVSASREWLPRNYRGTVLAVGQATARAATQAGWTVQPVAAGQNSEALLAAHPQLRGHILIIGGSGGRRTLKQQLQARDCIVDKLIVYRREGVDYPGQTLRQAIEQSPVLVFSSGHALRQWRLLADRHQQPQALQLPLLVASPRLCKLARTLGFEQPAIALPQMSDSALLTALNERMR